MAASSVGSLALCSFKMFRASMPFFPNSTTYIPMEMLFHPGDRVQIRKSKRGYTGSGEIIDLAFGINFLVKVEIEGKETVILVRAMDMVHLKTEGKKKNGN